MTQHPAVPQHCPTARELDDLELLLSGALAPRTTFDAPGAGPVTLDLPEDLRGRDVELVDPEGLPLARLSADGELTGLTHPQFGPFRHLYLTPAEARTQHAGRSWLPVTDALTEDELDRIGHGSVALLALVGTGTGSLPAVALLRATVAAAASLDDAVVVAVPLARHGDTESAAVADAALRGQVVATYAGPDPVWALPARAGEPPLDAYTAEIADIVASARPGPDEHGAVLFFTGLSGSGKSTIARALTDRILEQGRRTITSLDGDVVRRNLSAGLTFSKADRETNIRRIGWVAAEVSRHGGLAVCSPIAPFDETRQQVRAMVEEAGGRFFLVHVATPLEECERRDRKGLYAKARRGEIGEFTGISSPYEAPADADVVVDTTGRSVDDVTDEVVRVLGQAGIVDLPLRTRPEGRTPGTSTASHAGPRASSPMSAPRRRAHATGGSLPRLAVLFVDTTNTGRSAYMQLTAALLLGKTAEVTSAGTEAESGHPMDREIAAALPEGATADGFASKPVSADLVEVVDLVLTAEGRHADELVSQHPTAAGKVFSLGEFAAIAAGTVLRGRDLLEHADHLRAAQRPAYDVPAEPAQEAAQRIREHLEVVVPALRDG